MTVDPAAAARTLAREAGLDPDRLREGPVWLELVALGWATVEATRAADELGLPADPGAVLAADPDELLGATCSIWRPAPDEPSLVLLEPATEGRLAASLARRGEGPTALYLAAPAGLADAVAALGAAGTRCRPGRGPFGPAALVLGRPSDGPDLVLVGVPSGA